MFLKFRMQNTVHLLRFQYEKYVEQRTSIIFYIIMSAQHLKSWASRLLIQQFVLAYDKEN